MIRFVMLVATLSLLVACNEEKKPVASREASPGGINFTLLHLLGQGTVAIHVAWTKDWPGVNKAATLIGTELILVGGAEGYPAGRVGERFADMKSEGTVYVSANDQVVGEWSFERSHLDETVAIANAHLRAPTLDQMWFDRIRDGLEFDAMRCAVFDHASLRKAQFPKSMRR